jgi:lipopolysaccharide transport system ATP-binding protein
MTRLYVDVKNVTKRYRIGRGITTLRDIFAWWDKSEKSYHWAVNDVSFSLEPGESLGIIGPNGAGKTTMLKLLSRVTKPTSGEITLNGRFSALIELGAGFHPDLTGRENVYLNGAILGMTHTEINERFDDIVNFSGIGHFIDTPVKRYSSGMHARLGFAIAAHVDPKILLVDEVLAVGDYAFQMKCYARMDALRKNGTSLIFVSHNMEAVRRVCDRGLVMYQGEPIFEGTAAEAVVAYSNAVRKAARESSNDQRVPLEGGLSQRVMTFDAEIEKVTLLNQKREPATVLNSGQKAYVLVDVDFQKDVDHPIFGFFIRTADGRRVYTTTTNWQGVETPCFRVGEKCQVQFEIDLPLIDGNYDLGVDVAAPDLSSYYDRLERALTFQTVGCEQVRGIVDLNAKITFHQEPVFAK